MIKIFATKKYSSQEQKTILFFLKELIDYSPNSGSKSFLGCLEHFHQVELKLNLFQSGICLIYEPGVNHYSVFKLFHSQSAFSKNLTNWIIASNSNQANTNF